MDCITETGVRMKDGTEHQFDIIVLGVGFKVSQYLWPVNYVGTQGMTLEKAWEKDGARSYLGMVMPNYPNFFTLYGPNHQPRGGSLPSYSEVWSRYAVSSIVGMIERGAKSMEIKQEVFDKYQTELDQKNNMLIWESEGAGYFLNKHGRQQVNMPWSCSEYHTMVKDVKPEEFKYTF
jgi:4-hydroxyacetophenone monooxygenase